MDEDRLALAFLDLAGGMLGGRGADELLVLLCSRATDVLGAPAAGALLLDEEAVGGVRSSWRCPATREAVGALEYQGREGPTLDALRTGESVDERDLAGSADLWPEFSQRALAHGFRTASAYPMRRSGETLGALGLLRVDDARGRDAVVAQALADVAALALVQQRSVREARELAAELQVALTDRIAVEQATGVLAERMDVHVYEALSFLRVEAERSGRTLGAVARSVLDGAVADPIGRA